MRGSRQQLGRDGSALTRYSLRMGQLVDRQMASAALIAARQEAEREAAEARQAKLEIEIANNALREEMEVRLGTQSRLAYLASHDPLTALPNRSLFSGRLSAEMEASRAQGSRLALLYIDLDNFKDVNDTLGHAVGDSLLQQVSVRIANELRSGDTVARLGGDEFAVLQVGLSGSNQASALGERVIGALGQPFDIDGRTIFIGASIGVTLFPDDADAVDLLHRNADLAMYRAKSEGRNCCHFYNEAMNQEVHRRAFLEQALREPSVMSQMHLLFQPQIDMKTCQITGVEALLRWHHPEQGSIPPEEFIPLAERTGMIIDIGAWVLRESCKQAMRWRDAGLPPLIIAVNVATAQFRFGNMPRLVATVLAETGLPASMLELEITETGIMHDMHVAAETLVNLHKQGVALAIDDFGTGYSSLSYLRKLPVDRLKIDRSFVNDVTTSEDAAVIATTIVELAHALRLEVVAEGVETAEQAKFVRDSGCAFAQGHFYGRPTTADKIAALLNRAPDLELAQ
ncbi:bifunctional diguanylate cyclase/phosphodiesterase [Acidisphaera sp. L21]|uniref:putative bifunctional diguanylate cyclase/phosphodiesterase n=1 Tax=Acidisphaera sp. L21 TaxID=1641851 RepID=UPI00131C5702|nr:EAL domain-containing protein [Acidisphaera sp. L21]